MCYNCHKLTVASITTVTVKLTVSYLLITMIKQYYVCETSTENNSTFLVIVEAHECVLARLVGVFAVEASKVERSQHVLRPQTNPWVTP